MDADIAKAVKFAKGHGLRVQEHYDYKPTSAGVLEYIELIEAQDDFALDYETPVKSAAEEEEELLGGDTTDIQVAGLSHAPGWCLGVPGDMLSLLRPLFTRRRTRPMYCRVFNWGFEGYHSKRQFGDLGITPIDLMMQLNRSYSDLKRKDLGSALSLFTDMPYTKNLGNSNPDRYNACDTYGTLWASREAQMKMEAMRIFHPVMDADMPLYDWVIDCKTTGINCDTQLADRLELQMYKALDAYEKFWVEKLPTVDWQSPQQLIAMFTAMGLPQVLRKRPPKNKGEVAKFTPSCDQDVLEMYRDKHQNQLANLLLTMRELKKASDFTHLAGSDGRAHPGHKLHGQKAGRIQAKNPDLQNIPEELAGIYPRTIIIPDDPNTDCIISGDFDAAEFYIYGFASNDEPILKCRREGRYIYGMFYEDIFKKPFFEPGKPPKKDFRRKDIPPWELLVAKSGPLGMLYGRGPKSLQDGFGIAKSRSVQIYDGFMQEHWQVARHHNDLLSEAGSYGYCRNFFDRIRWFPHVHTLRNEILAWTGQSNLADILERVLKELYVGLGNFGARLLFPVHDSIQVSCPRRALFGCVSYVREVMEQPWPQMINKWGMKNFWLPCTLKVGTLETSTTGKPNWGDTIVWEDWIVKYSRAVGGIPSVSGQSSTGPDTSVV
jgi:DNA polymerase I-like protein with 3'-5' exonuclease and polymerase domains